MKLARLLGITMSLLTHEKISAKEFACKYEVSVRTILRDMDELSAAGIPIVAIQGNNGGFSILDSFKLERNFLTVQEMGMLKSLLQGFDTSVFEEDSHELLNKLVAVNNESEQSNWNSIVLDFSGWADPIHLKNMVDRITKAIDSGKVLEIQYFNNNGHESHRFIHPYRLLFKNSTWYVQAYCETSQDFRIFKLVRIKVVYETERFFEKLDVEVPKDEKFLGDGKNSEHIKLLFKKEALSRLFDFFGRESMTFLEDGNIVVDVHYPIDEWVYFTIFSFNEQVEVLEPEHLRVGMKERLHRMMEKYVDD